MGMDFKKTSICPQVTSRAALDGAHLSDRLPRAPSRLPPPPSPAPLPHAPRSRCFAASERWGHRQERPPAAAPARARARPPPAGVRLPLQGQVACPVVGQGATTSLTECRDSLPGKDQAVQKSGVSKGLGRAGSVGSSKSGAASDVSGAEVPCRRAIAWQKREGSSDRKFWQCSASASTCQTVCYVREWVGEPLPIRVEYSRAII